MVVLVVMVGHPPFWHLFHRTFTDLSEDFADGTERYR